MKCMLRLIGIVALLSTQFAYPHHSNSVDFDVNRLITINGSVTELQLINPHSRIFLDVTNDAGEIENWTVAMAGKLALVRRGWTDDILSKGDRVTVIGNPSHTGKPAVWFKRILMEDGTELLDPLLDDVLKIDEQRRQRVLELKQK